MSDIFCILPDEAVLNIIQHVIDSGTSAKNCIALLNNITFVNKYFHVVTQDWQIWKRIAARFNDYVRLEKRYKAVDIEWYTIVKERLSGVFIEREVIVGPRDAPERKHLIQVHGNGIMFIGTNISGRDADNIEHFDRMVLQENIQHNLVRYHDTNYVMIPFHMQLEIVSGDVKLLDFHHILDIADVSTYDPFVLVLTSDGHVIEFMFKPSYDTKWDNCAKPRMLQLEIPMDKIYAMDYACFAIGDGRVWCWSIIDHPDGTRYNIKTNPTQLIALEPYYVYFIERSRTGFTKVYYVVRQDINEKNKYLYRSPSIELEQSEHTWFEIPDEQVMAIMIMSVFNDDEMHDIAALVQGI